MQEQMVHWCTWCILVHHPSWCNLPPTHIYVFSSVFLSVFVLVFVFVYVCICYCICISSRWCTLCIGAPPQLVQPTTHHPHQAVRVCPHAKPQTASQVKANFSAAAALFPLYDLPPFIWCLLHCPNQCHVSLQFNCDNWDSKIQTF